MAINDYHFITEWHIPGTIDEVFDVLLGEAVSLKEWWPSVYLDVQVLEKGDERGVGQKVGLFTKGWLPYTLRWSFIVTEAERPHRVALEAMGDFVGRGIWTLEQTGDQVKVTYDWKIRAGKPLLQKFSYVMKPIFEANHRWAMDMGEKSLKLELQRRRASTPEAAAKIPPPPPPTFR